MKSILLLLIFFSSAISASELRLQWTNATENVDSSSIPETGDLALDRTSVGWWLCSGPSSVSDVNWTDFSPAQTSATIIFSDTPGTYCFRAAHRNALGQWSDGSNIVRKTIADDLPPTGTGPPNPPSNLRLQ